MDHPVETTDISCHLYLGVGNAVADGLHDALVEGRRPGTARLALQLEDAAVRLFACQFILEDGLRLRAAKVGELVQAEPRLVVHPVQLVGRIQRGKVRRLAELGLDALDRPRRPHERGPAADADSWVIRSEYEFYPRIQRMRSQTMEHK